MTAALLRKPLDLAQALGRIVASPVLWRELRSGLRERRIIVIQSVYVTCLAGITLLILASAIDTPPQGRPVLKSDAGQMILIWTFLIQWMMVVLVAPSLTCGLVTSEREKKTYEMLTATLLSPAEVVGGKLLFGLSYVAFLLVSSLPVTATVFFLGGVSPAEVLLFYGTLLLSGLIVLQIALFFSARETRTATATNQSYGLTFLLMIAGMTTAPALFLGYARQHTLFEQLLETYEYYGMHIPYVLLPALTVAWLSIFLFLKTMNAVQNKAQHILWVHRLFVLWSGAALFLLTAMECARSTVSATWSGEVAGTYLSRLAIVLLFFQGMLTNHPRLLAEHDRRTYRTAVSSKALFFPMLLLLLFALAAVMLAAHGLSATSLWRSFLVMAALLAGLLGAARALVALSGHRMAHAVAYFILYSMALLSPLLYAISYPHEASAPSAWTFLFASPFMSIASLWTKGNPQSIDLGGLEIPLWEATCAFYVMVAVGGALLAFLLRKRGVRA